MEGGGGMSSLVAAARSGYQDARGGIGRALARLQLPPLDNRLPVVIKINVCDARTAETATITHPVFLDALLQHLRESCQGLRICVVESDATVVLADRFIRWFGYVPVLEKWNAEFVNLSRTKALMRKINGRYFKEVPVPDILDQPRYFITTPRLKTNPMSTMTCCLKNQFGCLPEVEKGAYHPRLDDVIADVNLAMRPDLCVVDAITVMGGIWGPAFGVPIPQNAIFCSRDPVAADAYGARLMGLRPRSVGHIRKSASSGVGSMRYVLAGDRIDRVDFETSWSQMRLLRMASFLQRKSQRRFRAGGGSVP